MRFSTKALLFFLLSFQFSLFAPEIQAQQSISTSSDTPMKLTSHPCMDYFGYSNVVEARIGFFADTTPGLYHFYHIPLLDSNITYTQSAWKFDINGGPNDFVASYPGDTITHQFTHNGLDTLIIYAYYIIPYPMECPVYGDTTILISGLVENQTASPEPSMTVEYAVRAYPNPTSGPIQLEWEDKAAQTTEIQLFSIHGQRLGDAQHFHNGKAKLDLHALAPGCYPMILTGPTGMNRIMVVRE